MARRTAATSSMVEALLNGQGVERPFRCEVHDDKNASASMNILLGVWFCYACHAKGNIDPKKAVSLEALKAMMEPEQTARIYPESYLDLFDFDAGNFAKRFPLETRRRLRLGCDPLTGDATFPVRDGVGRLCGVGRRRPEGEPRYVYPRHWSASQALFMGERQLYARAGYVVVVEGAADASSLLQINVPAVAVYGAGVHLPQKELIRRMRPRGIIYAFDADEAGVRAYERSRDMFTELGPEVRIDWDQYGGKDPASIDVVARHDAVAQAEHELRKALDGV